MATRVEAREAAGPAARYGAMGILWAVSISHFVNDGATSLLNPFLPHIRDHFGVSIGDTAILVAVLSFTGSLIQPFTGALADRVDRRTLAAVGPVVTVAGMALMGYAPSFALLVALLALAGFGSALFHPSGAAYAVMRVRPDRRGLSAALFSSAGTAGLAVGPLLSKMLDLRGLVVVTPAGLVVGLASWLLTPSTAHPGGAGEAVRRRWRDYAEVFRGPIRTLWAMSVLRSLSTTAFLSLIPFVLEERGAGAHTPYALAVFEVAAAAGGVAGGRISDRVGRTRVLRSSVLLTIPLFIALVYSTPTSWWYYPLAALVGALVNANLPVSVVTAQEYAPDHVATASAMMMGFAWGTSGVLYLLVGKLADYTSPATALVASILVLLPAFWLTLKLPEPARHGTHEMREAPETR